MGRRIPCEHEEYERQTFCPICRQKRRMQQKNLILKMKLRVIAHYSNGQNTCARCNFSDVRALQIDHINGGGTKEVRELNETFGMSFYSYLIVSDFPEGYQVLCANCNWIKKAENNEVRK